jgi:cystinosin
LDATALQDFSGITGNLAKFFLGFVSIVFDAIFMVQHYALYRSDANDSGDDSGSILTSENVNDDISSGLVV